MASPQKQQRTKTQHGHIITIHGHYFADEGGHKLRKPYEITHYYSPKMIDLGPLSVFKNVLSEDLREHYPDFNGLETHYIKVAEREDGQPVTDIRLMHHTQLTDYINEQDYPIEVGVYRDDDQLRQAVMDWESASARNDEQGFLKNQAHLVKSRGPHLDMRTEARRFNPGGAISVRKPTTGADLDANHTTLAKTTNLKPHAPTNKSVGFKSQTAEPPKHRINELASAPVEDTLTVEEQKRQAEQDYLIQLAAIKNDKSKLMPRQDPGI